MFRLCGPKLKARKRNAEIRELLELEPDEKRRPRWFGHVERKDNANWVKRCMKMEADGTRKRSHPRSRHPVKDVMVWAFRTAYTL